MFFFSPIMTFTVLAFVGLIVAWLLVTLPTYRKKTAAVIAAQTAQGSFLIQNLHGIRTVKSLALDTRQKQKWDVLVARTAKARMAEGLFGNLVATIVRPLNTLAVTGSYALGVYLAMSTNDPVYIGALFAFLMLSQRVAAPLTQMAQLVNQYDEARISGQHCCELGQPAAGGGALRPRRAHAAEGQCRVRQGRVQVQGIDEAGAQRASRSRCRSAARSG